MASEPTNMLFDVTSDQILLISVVATLVLNTLVCLAVAFNGSFSAHQKAAQAILVWVVPYLGAVMIGLFLVGDRSSARYRTNTVGARDLDSYAANLPAVNSRGL